MVNDVYEHAVLMFGKLFGKAQPLNSGTGVRFTNSSRGKVTIYHEAIAAGNRAEMAIDPATFSRRLRRTHSQTLALIQQLRTHTGRDVDRNPQHDWPRIGFSTKDDVNTVAEILTTRINEAP